MEAAQELVFTYPLFGGLARDALRPLFNADIAAYLRDAAAVAVSQAWEEVGREGHVTYLQLMVRCPAYSPPVCGQASALHAIQNESCFNFPWQNSVGDLCWTT